MLEQKREGMTRTERVREKLSSRELKEKVRENKGKYDEKLKRIRIHPFGLENRTLGWYLENIKRVA